MREPRLKAFLSLSRYEIFRIGISDSPLVSLVSPAAGVSFAVSFGLGHPGGGGSFVAAAVTLALVRASQSGGAADK